MLKLMSVSRNQAYLEPSNTGGDGDQSQASLASVSSSRQALMLGTHLKNMLKALSLKELLQTVKQVIRQTIGCNKISFLLKSFDIV